jgi:hypothetical protein
MIVNLFSGALVPMIRKWLRQLEIDIGEDFGRMIVMHGYYQFKKGKHDFLTFKQMISKGTLLV